MWLFISVALGPVALAADPTSNDAASIGFAAGSLMGDWPDGGVHTGLMLRYEVFPGPLGVALWGAQTVGWRQNAIEEVDGQTETFPFDTLRYGALAMLRSEPEAPIGGAFGFGFGRIDLDDYYDGPHILPTLTFEGGARARCRQRGFVEALGRAHWAQARGLGDALDEWWGAELVVSVGVFTR